MIGIALVPDSESVDRLITFQNYLNEHVELSPTLNKVDKLPHISLLHGDIQDIDALVKTTEKLFSDLRIQDSIIPEAFVYQETGWLFLTMKECRWLHDLHRALFDAVGKYIVPPKNINKDISHYTAKQKQYFSRYGYRYILDEYYPHYTLGKLADNLIGKDEIVELGNTYLGNAAELFIQKPERYVIFELGEYGSTGEIIVDKKLNERY